MRRTSDGTSLLLGGFTLRRVTAVGSFCKASCGRFVIGLQQQARLASVLAEESESADGPRYIVCLHRLDCGGFAILGALAPESSRWSAARPICGINSFGRWPQERPRTNCGGSSPMTHGICMNCGSARAWPYGSAMRAA